MNARLYDPKLHRFLAPDNFIQDPSNSQNYNRYGYVWNNPLRYNDPRGEVVWAVAIGAAVGVIMNGINNSSHGQPFFQGVIKSAGIGAISGALSFGAGSAVLGIGGTALQQAGTGILLHGASAGMSSGDFWSGFVVGGVSSGVASGIGATGISNQYWMAGAQIGGATIVGGASSVLAGGNFWDGARQGFITAALNHVAHGILYRNDLHRDPPYEYNGEVYESKSALYTAILVDQFAEQFGIKDIVALAAALDNKGLLSKPFVMDGASKGTSYASKYGSKLLPQEMPKRLPTHFR